MDLVVGVERFPNPGETLRGTSFETFLGGKGGNQAMAAARLGGRPRMVGRVGNDQFGRRYLDALKESGASVEGVGVTEGEPTGTALIEVESTGQNRIVIVPGANGAMDKDAVLQELSELKEGELVLLQLEIPLPTVWAVAAEAHRRGALTILDPAPADTIPPEALSSIAWITPNEHEAALITGIDTGTDYGLQAAATKLVESGVSYAVVKAGARGAYLSTSEEPSPTLIPGYPVDAVDTTAAGDSFNGGLAWALATGHSPEAAVAIANAVGALAVTGMGAQTAMPSQEELTAFLKQS